MRSPVNHAWVAQLYGLTGRLRADRLLVLDVAPDEAKVVPGSMDHGTVNLQVTIQIHTVRVQPIVEGEVLVQVRCQGELGLKRPVCIESDDVKELQFEDGVAVWRLFLLLRREVTLVFRGGLHQVYFILTFTSAEVYLACQAKELSLPHDSILWVLVRDIEIIDRC